MQSKYLKGNSKGRLFAQKARAVKSQLGLTNKDIAIMTDSSYEYVKNCFAANYAQDRPKWAKLFVALGEKILAEKMM